LSAERLNASVEASGLIRRVQSTGDFAAILRKGDPERGALLLVISSRGEYIACLQRRLQPDSGRYEWASAGPKRSASSREVLEFLDSQARFDPDSWQIEVDIADPERFIAETTAQG